jgi:hypothetical protein
MPQTDGLPVLRNRLGIGASGRRRKRAHAYVFAAEISRLEDRCLLSTYASGSETLINAGVAGQQKFSSNTDHSIDVTAQGTLIATWSSNSSRIVARQFSANGSPLGNEFAVSTTRVGSRGNAVVATQKDRVFVVAWVSEGNRQDPSGRGIFARTFFENGTPLSGEVRINATIAGNQKDPSIAWISSDRFVVAWSGAGKGDSQGVFVRVFDVSGKPVTGEIRVPETSTGKQEHPVVIAVPGGGFQVAWNGNGVGDRVGIFSRQFDALGRPVGPEFRVNTSDQATEQQPSITVIGSEQVIIAWQVAGHGLDSQGSGIAARRFALDGTALGEEFLVNQTTSGSQQDPSISYLSDGGFVIAWDGSGVGDADGIFAREYNGDGSARGGERRVNSTTTGVQAHATVRAQGPAGYAVAWSGNVGAVSARSGALKSRAAAGGGDKSGIAVQQLVSDQLVSFAGYNWNTNYHYNADSGWYDNGQQWAPQNVYVDQQGLHLKLQTATVGGQYTAFSSAEAVLVQDAAGNPFVPGFGTYLVAASTSGNFNRLASNNGAIFGAFTYENLRGDGTISGNTITGLPQSVVSTLKAGMGVSGQDYQGNPLFRTGTTIQSIGPGTTINLSTGSILSGPHTIYFTDLSLVNSHRELDMIEASRFGIQTDPTNAQFTLQPYQNDPNNVHRITLQDQGNITLTMKWLGANQPVVFSLYYGIFDLSSLPANADLTWTTDAATQNQFIPNSYNQAFHLNLWRAFWKNPPNPQPDEVIVKNFQFQAL